MDFFKYRNGFNVVLSLLVILYCVYSVAMLWVAYVAETIGGEMGISADEKFLIFHSVASYILVILVTGYHMYTFIHRRKRKNDKTGEAPGPKPAEVQ